MNTVRFTHVVQKSGNPEVYLLLSETDKIFHDALEASRIMSLVGGVDGAKTEYGLVGYDRKRRGQLLLFPRSLKAFADSRVVGIKFDLLAESKADHSKKPGKPAAQKPKRDLQVHRPTGKHDRVPKPLSPRKPEKVISFPSEEEPEERTLEDMTSAARRALRALEKNNSVVAYKILKDALNG
jgi:hypothetical protein